jgi:hypothetical protein
MQKLVDEWGVREELRTIPGRSVRWLGAMNWKNVKWKRKRGVTGSRVGVRSI